MPKLEIVIEPVSDLVSTFELHGWNYSDGDIIKFGDVLGELENDKATVEIFNPIPKGFEGILSIVIERGKDLSVDTMIGVLEVSYGAYEEWRRINNSFHVYVSLENNDYDLYCEIKGDRSSMDYVKELILKDIEEHR